MLDRVDFPLSNSQISQFVLEKGYTNYFNLQTAIHELIENEFIKPDTIRNTSFYSITKQGKEAMDLFEFKLSDVIKLDILNFFAQEKIKLRNESNISADYYPSNNEYIVECIIKERSQTILELKMNVPNKGLAVTICDNWKEKSEDVYHYLIKNIWTERGK